MPQPEVERHVQRAVDAPAAGIDLDPCPAYAEIRAQALRRAAGRRCHPLAVKREIAAALGFQHGDRAGEALPREEGRLQAHLGCNAGVVALAHRAVAVERPGAAGEAAGDAERPDRPFLVEAQ